VRTPTTPLAFNFRTTHNNLSGENHEKPRQNCATLALTLALVLPAFAGTIGTDKAEPPPPPSVTADGTIGTDKTGTTTATVTEIALSLLQSVIALF
jgi:hypothetical protein